MARPLCCGTVLFGMAGEVRQGMAWCVGLSFVAAWQAGYVNACLVGVGLGGLRQVWLGRTSLGRLGAAG